MFTLSPSLFENSSNLELAPGRSAFANRLPWHRRASPSATLDGMSANLRGLRPEGQLILDLGTSSPGTGQLWRDCRWPTTARRAIVATQMPAKFRVNSPGENLSNEKLTTRHYRSDSGQYHSATGEPCVAPACHSALSQRLSVSDHGSWQPQRNVCE